MTDSILDVKDLSVYYRIKESRVDVKAVNQVSFKITSGDSIALIGESGCGKSTLALAILKVLPPSARIMQGEIRFDGENILERSDSEMTRIRGRKMSMIMQDPMTSLNPLFSIGNQMAEGLRRHLGLRKNPLYDRLIELLQSVHIPAPELRLKQFPHEMSGGMRQRIVGAIALSCNPKLIIADEPTTALDATIQLQFMNLLRDIQQETNVTLLFITHNLGIVAEMCQYVMVMYAGKIVERAPVEDIFDDPKHPYTRALLDSAFSLEDQSERKPIEGEPPDLSNLPPGCSFFPRCDEAQEICQSRQPAEKMIDAHCSVCCWKYL